MSELGQGAKVPALCPPLVHFRAAIISAKPAAAGRRIGIESL